MGALFGGGRGGGNAAAEARADRQEQRNIEDRERAEKERTAIAGEVSARSRRKRRGTKRSLFAALEGVTTGLSETLG